MINLNYAATKAHSLEHLVEAQGDHERFDCIRVLRGAEGDADDHRVHHNTQLEYLKTIIIVIKD